MVSALFQFAFNLCISLYFFTQKACQTLFWSIPLCLPPTSLHLGHRPSRRDLKSLAVNQQLLNESWQCAEWRPSVPASSSINGARSQCNLLSRLSLFLFYTFYFFYYFFFLILFFMLPTHCRWNALVSGWERACFLVIFGSVVARFLSVSVFFLLGINIYNSCKALESVPRPRPRPKPKPKPKK